MNHMTTQIENDLGIICIIPNSPRPENFILDTGATNHVCHTQDSFQCIKRINPITIKQPNGAFVTTNYAGSIHF